jgi:hypothetical protein
MIISGFRRLSAPRFEEAACAHSWQKSGDAIERATVDFKSAPDEGYLYGTF